MTDCADQPRARHVVITGASRGLGRALALAFAAPHVSLGIHYGHADAAARAVAAAVQARGAQAYLIRVDLSATDAAGQIAAQVHDHGAALDVLILNAGVVRVAALVRTSSAAWDHILEINYRQQARLAQQLGETLLGRGSHLLAVGSLAGLRGGAGVAAYAAAKGALLGFVRDAAARWGARGICVNAILPGILATAMTSDLTTAASRALAHENVLGAPTTPDEVAAFAVHLCGTRHISGQLFALDSRVWPDGAQPTGGAADGC
ncbi:MAG: SDR family NAD(P)-dependent oxidoreductase [bacterium]|nr:SDR family NAD(P)-dependent oxidoreductase [bacterium]